MRWMMIATVALSSLLMSACVIVDDSNSADTLDDEFPCFLDFPCGYNGGTRAEFSCSEDALSINRFYDHTEEGCDGGECRSESTACEGEMRCATTAEGPLCVTPDVLCGGPEGFTCSEGEVCVLGEQYIAIPGWNGYATCDAYNAQAYGRCEQDLADCTTDITPVCGCDNITYDNGCVLRKAGVPIQREGACETP